MKVFINPGHDKVYDSGAKNDVLGIRECDIAYVIGALVEKYLNNVGIEIKSLQSDNLCNDTDYYNDRPIAVCDLANNWGADLFISIHCNSFNNSEARGTEVEVFSFNTEAHKLATCIQNQIVNSLNTVNRGVKEYPSLKVLKHTTMPAVLVETAFISNMEDAKKLIKRKDDIARAIARGVTDYMLLNK